MRFSEFREAMMRPSADPTPKSSTDSKSPTSMTGTRRVFRDWNSSPWDLDWLDASMCPDCAGDLNIVTTESKNIAFYDCTGNDKHKFVRIFHKPTTGPDASSEAL